MAYDHNDIDYGRDETVYDRDEMDYGRDETKYGRKDGKYGSVEMGLGEVELGKMEGFVLFCVKMEDLREFCGFGGWGQPPLGGIFVFLPSAGDMNGYKFFTAWVDGNTAWME